MKTLVTLEIDTDRLGNVTDQHLAELWHIAQANPAPMEDLAAGRLAESIGREIVRRFLATTPPQLWAHQGNHAYFAKILDLQQQFPDLQIKMPGAIQPEVASKAGREP